MLKHDNQAKFYIQAIIDYQRQIAMVSPSQIEIVTLFVLEQLKGVGYVKEHQHLIKKLLQSPD